MRRFVFVVGGARSGKSGHALSIASQIAGKKVYIATAEALDAEMEKRITAHKAERAFSWETIEEPIEVAEAVCGLDKGTVAVIDCLTLWVSNLMGKGLSDSEINGRAESLASACADSISSVVMVSNEVGLGLVPDNPLARRFRDLAGRINQLMAGKADEAWFMASGIPLRLK